jgi:hypothetical protein
MSKLSFGRLSLPFYSVICKILVSNLSIYLLVLSIVRLAFTCLGVCRVEVGPALHPASTEEELLVTYAICIQY